MVFNTPINNLIIDGNSFDYGKYTPDGNPASTPTIYKYFNNIIVNSDAIITNNFISGMAPPGQFVAGSLSSNLVIEANWSCVVKNNTFVRGDTTIYAYIVNNSLDDQIITDNVFDGYTVDGTDENLVKGIFLNSPPQPYFTPTGLSVGSTYNNNKNQTGYSILPVLVGEKLWSDGYTGPYNQDFISSPSTPSTFGGAGANNAVAAAIYATLILQDTTQHGYFRTYDITKIVPINTQILEVTQGIYSSPQDPIDTNISQISISIASGIINPVGYNSIIDVFNQIYTPPNNLGLLDSQTTTLSGAGLPAAIQSPSNYYLTIDSTIQNNLQYYFNTLQSSLTISIEYLLKLSTYSGSTPTGIVFSPIRIKYRW